MGRVAAPHIITDDSALGGSVIERSLRINSGDSAYLSRNHSTDGNRRTFTISFWTKKSNMSDTGRVVFQSRLNSNSSDQLQIQLRSEYRIRVLGNSGGSVNLLLDTTSLFRESSAWYHIVFAVDTTQGNASDRNKLYVNGTQITQFQSSAHPSSFTQNTETPVNQASSRRHLIGCQRPNTSSTLNAFMDGYLAEFNLIDGQQYDPSFFGYTESQTGLWRPKRYEGTYGTNGFHLEFKDNSSTSALGKDTSGNGNDFTTNNFAVSDSMPDTPTNNFATYDPLAESGGSYSEGNLKVVSTADPASSTIGFTSGKFYFEVYVDATNNMYIGVIPIDFGLNPGRGGGWDHGAIAYKANGDQYSLKAGQSSVSASYGASYTAGDIIGCAVDIDNDTITFYKNGVSQGNTTNGVSYVSATGAKDQTYGALAYCNGGNNIMRANFGQDSTFQGTVSAGGNKDASGLGDFKYAVPSGYNALCSKNLPLNVPTIINPQKHFDTLLYNGNGSSQTLSGLNFAPDWVWIKMRSHSGDNHHIYDTVRGAAKTIFTNTTGAEQTNDTDRLSAFNSNGFTLGNNYRVNGSGKTFVAWCWKAGGAAVSNTDGTITSQVSANPTAGFSIVTYTGNHTSGATVGHGLGVAPKVVIVKARGTINSQNRGWNVYHASIGNTKYIQLNSDNVSVTNSDWWNNTSPNSTTFTLGNDYDVNANISGGNYVAYCWAEIPGYSKFGIYKGNSNANGTFVHVGFRPAWLMIKRTTGADAWVIYDNKRDPDNVMRNRLAPNTNAADAADDAIDFLSNGFKWRINSGLRNDSSHSYIFMAFAEQTGITPYDTQTNAR